MGRNGSDSGVGHRNRGRAGGAWRGIRMLSVNAAREVLCVRFCVGWNAEIAWCVVRWEEVVVRLNTRDGWRSLPEPQKRPPNAMEDLDKATTKEKYARALEHQHSVAYY